MNPPYQDHYLNNTTISTPSTTDYYNTVFDHPDNYNPPPPPPDTSSNHLLSQYYYYQIHSNHHHGIINGGALSPSAMESMREMIFRMAAMQPILDEVNLETVRPKQRKNVKISTDPQSVAARRRRERISERIRILQRMVPGGTKMDTASMLDEAARYVEFLKREVKYLEDAAATAAGGSGGLSRDHVMWPGSSGGAGTVVDGGSYYNYTSGYENNNSSSCSSTGNY